MNRLPAYSYGDERAPWQWLLRYCKAHGFSRIGENKDDLNFDNWWKSMGCLVICHYYNELKEFKETNELKRDGGFSKKLLIT